MTKEFYEKISAPFRKSPRGARILNDLNVFLTGITFLAYPELLIVLLIRGDRRLIPAALVPGTAFALVTLLRRAVNAPRPYEALDIAPLIQRDSKGKSFPSRHIFSIFVIAMTFLNILPALGVFFLLCGTVLAAIRVIGGVHFPRDVIAGALAGILAGTVMPALYGFF